MPTTTPVPAERRGGGRALRTISFVLALVPTAAIFLYPRLVGAGSPDGLDYTLLVLTLSGISAAFAHGVGFVPRNRLLGWVLSPAYAWPAIGVGATLLLVL
jgi:predicted membrane protein